MKKFSALLLAVVMLASIISTCMVATSAAGNTLTKSYDSAVDGDLLYQVKFGETEGVYQSAYFASAYKNTPDDQAPVISADKREVTITYAPTKSGHSYYGSGIEGLTLGEGKSYTIKFLAKYDTANSNAGVYFNFPSKVEGELVENVQYHQLRGHYGTPDVRNTLAIGGNKATGKNISHDTVYITEGFGGLVYPRNAEGYHEMAIEVEGDIFRVYINGALFDEAHIPDAGLECMPNLGFSIYVYNAGTFSVKDVDVYKGCMMKGAAVVPEYKHPYAIEVVDNPNSTNKLLKEYSAAADGDLLYQFNFAAKDGIYVPGIINNNGKDYATNPYVQVEILDNGNGVKFTNNGTNGAFWWGGLLNAGLSVTEDTKYTLEYKVTNHVGGLQGGLGWSTDPDSIIAGVYNFYGRHNNIGDDSAAQMVIEQAAGKIKGEVYDTTAYTVIFPKVDEQGFTNVKVELDGRYFNVYYESMFEEGGTYWTLFERYDMFDEENPNSYAYTDNTLACMFYIYNASTSLTFKDVKLYKGLTAEKAVTTVPEETTTPEVTTTAKPAETTTAPTATTTAAPTATTTAAEAKGGCGGAVAGGLAVVAIVTLAGVAVSKKH